MTLYELCRHDVVDLSTGANLGSVDDIIFDSAAATVTHLVLYGKPRLFGLLGRGEDLQVPWQEIEKIGRDVVRVRSAPPSAETQKKTRRLFEML